MRFIFILSAFIAVTFSPLFSAPAWLKAAVANSQNFSVAAEASAIVLHHSEKVEISPDGNASIIIQDAHKILNSDGFEHGFFHSPIYPFRKIVKLNGWLIDNNNSVVSLAKENILLMDTNGSTGYYDDSHLQAATFSGIKPGVIVAYEAQIEETGWTSLYQSFIFQEQQPVLLAQYSVSIPPGWRLGKAEWRLDEIEFEQKENVQTWSARELPFQPEEPLAPSWYYLSRRIAVNAYNPLDSRQRPFTNWNAVSQWCDEAYREPAAADVQIQEKALQLTKDKISLEEILREIARFCQIDIRYVAIEIGKGRWKPRPATTTFYNRFGDCKDKTTLMRAMLQSLGIPSWPVLASVNYPVDPRLPTPFQFDHCILGVPVDEKNMPTAFQNAVIDGHLFFDPTDPSTTLGNIPWALQGGYVLVGSAEDSALIELPYPEPEDNYRRYEMDGIIKEDGSIQAQVKIIDLHARAYSTGYQLSHSKEKDQIQEWITALSPTVPGVVINNWQTVIREDTVILQFQLEGQRYLQKSGIYSLFRANPFQTDIKPQLTSAKRQFPVWFGSPRKIETILKWHFPESMSVELDTTQLKNECRSALLHSKVSAQDHTITYSIINSRNGKLIWPEEYPSARQFNQDESKMSKQMFLLKKS